MSILPEHDCQFCPRLVDYRNHNKELYPEGWNAPVPPWGDKNAQFLIVGLAPGVKGANLSGRPFTGDYAGTLLYTTLIKYNFASGKYKADPNDGLTLKNCRIINAVRCVPPENKPIGVEEKSCRPFLLSEVKDMPNLRIILALGVVAHKNVLATFQRPLNSVPFKHGQFHSLNDTVTLADSYHVSRYNTSTRVLTTEMFENIILKIKNFI